MIAQRSRQRGQALVELGIVIVLIVTLAMGIIEFGRAFMIINMITNAAREGARVASVMQASARDANNCITAASKTTISNMVIAQVANVSSTSGITVNTTQTCTGTIPIVTVAVSGTVNYLFGLPGLGSGINFNRGITFGDEGRPSCAPTC